MGTEVRVPRLPESVTEAVVGDWHKKPGDRVQRDETLLDLETDKVVLDVPSPGAGVLREVKKEKGATVGSEEVLGIIEAAGEAEEETAQESSPKSTPSKQAPESKTQATEKKKTRADSPETAFPSKETEAEKMPPLSPAVRRLVREHQLDPRGIPATGRDGRLTKADVVQFLQAEEEQEPAATPPPTEPEAPETKPAPAPREEGYGVRREAMSRLRQRIAERMLESQQTTATLSTFNEVNMQGIMELRHRYRDAFEERYGVRLGFMSFFIKACIEAFKRYPVVNAAVQDDDILYYHYYHIGIAVATPRGLVVPVLRDADQLSFADIELQIMDFAERARSGRLTIEELSGGTFTITNGGVFGSLLSTPILNPPQSAILGMHKIEDRPVAENGEVKIRPMMYVALSYDHRLIDGKGAVQFLVAVKEALEDPVRLLLEV
ncbi:2-oxoglutarate dehydrogenase E2 component [Nitrosococcus oceani ATCC 19707]|uniref:Dihydrolipoyllysine-residue succinyltransferase component of 2-oxoglutarate dehydrogenase complex n=2 Tax=Nitrosococcus oceani TaxID=1229 RepID=Q3JEV1_NITOC|nr:2-oxoglutarate dehydrogenase complex dihydrolipoyllysine-residue succinyltransferase [Nitrosococcus oceani]ABA56645.1 2-oxoglutarate dehydrogenase E2 component [Nitrosococcus oceani ATCC 19707]KFI20890.1 dihydrolipoamide succinyltransferase [Nitrosococcus oceani C-27]GEM20785.1 dihydrolipoamide succinyltransferase [Nitrosococcus oceani]